MSYIALTLGFTALFAVLSFHKEYKTTWSILCAVVFVLFGVINYNTLPVLQWWGFEGVWIEAFIVSLAGAGLHFAFCADDSDYEIKYAWRFIPTGITVLAFFIAGFQSWEMFHADEYYKRLKVETVPDSVFNADVHPIPVSKMISVDGKLACKVAEDKLGEDLGLGSRVEVGNMTIQNITGEFTINNGKKLVFNNDLIWVAPLEHRSFWKWFRNGHTPGYIIVDATDATRRWLVTEVNGQKLRIQYLESGRFGDDIERHIKGNGYASKGLNDHCFEIDGNGNPYWVLSSYDQKIGFGGEESEGPITVDAQTGELKAYSIEDAPAWIDRIQPQSFIEDQIRCWGEYKDGWWNAVWAQIGIQEPTPGTTLVYSEGRSFWYTGIQSAGADNGTNGFMLVDTRTKAAKFYRVIGINETEAMRIADDQPFAKAAQYSSNFPVLYNVRGIPTYFMTMKGSSGNVVGYCFLAVNNRQAVGSGVSKQDAEAAYLRMLKKTYQDKIKDGDVNKETRQFTVRAIVQESNVYYILFNEVKGIEFTGSTEFYPELKWTKPGDKVKVSYGKGESKVIPLDFYENLDFEI